MTIAELFAARQASKQAIILDGALATELEQRGHDLRDPLWSTKILLQQPEAIEQLHYDYLSAGADCIITATYQADFSLLQERGLSFAEADRIMRSATALAQAARYRWRARQTATTIEEHQKYFPLVAASVGPYGALRHDGSEYHGDYGLSVAELIPIHRPRFQCLADSGADLLACETIPSLVEARALLEVLRETPNIEAWFSFSCRDSRHVCHGETLADCAALLDDERRVAAIGVNCTAPTWITGLIKEIRGATNKPIVVYPNSGEQWDAATQQWFGKNSVDRFLATAMEWHAAGATLIGGCCRTGPSHIQWLAQHLGKSCHGAD